MRKEELLSALRNQIDEVSADDQGALRGGFAGSDVARNQSENSYCSANGDCTKNGNCGTNASCNNNSTCMNNLTCKGNGQCFGNYGKTKSADAVLSLASSL